MSFLDAFTGDAASKAAKNNLYAIGVGQQQAGGALESSAKAALGYIFGDGTNPGAQNFVDSGYNQAKGAQSAQYDATQGYLNGLQSLYQPLTQGGQTAYNAYLDATGANGADGSARAASAFTAAPGYQYALDSALGAVQRSAAARGGLAGGNTTAGILQTANGLASQGYQQYVNNLGNAAQSYQQGLAGQAQGLSAQAGASQNYGNALSALDTGQGNALATVYGQGAGIQTGLGQGVSNLVQNTTGALVNNNNALAAAQTKASENALGALVGTGKSILDFNPFKGL